MYIQTHSHDHDIFFLIYLYVVQSASEGKYIVPNGRIPALKKKKLKTFTHTHTHTHTHTKEHVQSAVSDFSNSHKDK